MNRIISIILCIFPSPIHVVIRRMLGQKIAKKTKIRFGTLIFSNKIEIGANTKIGPFTILRSDELTIGDHTIIKPFVLINTRIIELGNYVHFAPFSIVNSDFTLNSFLKINDHSRVFPFCWLDAGEGITIGKHVGIGGHTLMFTHGVWSNYIEGAPISRGPIIIKDNVWLPWRIFILPNVTINENVIVGANSLINKSITANSLVAGNPVKHIKDYSFTTDLDEKVKRFKEILERFSEHLYFKFDLKSELNNNRLILEKFSLIINEYNGVKNGDLIIVIKKDFKNFNEFRDKGVNILDYPNLTIYKGRKNKVIEEFISFLRQFGVRLYIK